MKCPSFALLLLLLGCVDNQDHSLCVPQNLDEALVKTPDYEFHIPYTIEKNRMMAEGDIYLTSVQEFMNKGLIESGRPWKNNKIFFKIHPDLPNKKRVTDAVKTWTKELGDLISFEEITEPVENYIEFIVSEGCWSQVGMSGGRQEIGLAKNCHLMQTNHEIGHALGLWHEQSRSDRDDFVEIKWCNIPEKQRHNFSKQSSGESIGRYDYKSLMHYSTFDFSHNLLPTVVSKTKTPVPLITPTYPSRLDVNALRCLYGDVEACSAR